jgi:hypothetical protein
MTVQLMKDFRIKNLMNLNIGVAVEDVTAVMKLTIILNEIDEHGRLEENNSIGVVGLVIIVKFQEGEVWQRVQESFVLIN